MKYDSFIIYDFSNNCLITSTLFLSRNAATKFFSFLNSFFQIKVYTIHDHFAFQKINNLGWYC